MIKKYLRLSSEQRTLVLMGALALFVFLVLCPLFLIEQGSYAMGWLLGSIIALICYWTMYRGNDFILSQSEKKNASMMVVLFYMGRFILMGIGLVLGAICTFKSEWFSGFNMFNFWGVAASYLLVFVFVPFRTLFASKKEDAVTVKEPEAKAEKAEEGEGK